MKVVINSPGLFHHSYALLFCFSKIHRRFVKSWSFAQHVPFPSSGIVMSCLVSYLSIDMSHHLSFCLYLCVFPPISPLSRFSFDAEVFCCLYINEVGEFCHSDTVGFTYHLMGGFTSSDTIETNREEEETALILFWVLHCYFFRGYLNNLHTDMVKKIMKARKCHIENISISQCYDCYC